MANIFLASEYNVRQCDRVYSDYRLKLLGIFCTDCDDAGEEAEMFGWVGFRMSESANWEK